MRNLVLVLSLVSLASITTSAQDATVPGKFTVEHPTLLNLGFEWSISRDAKSLAVVRETTVSI